MDKEAKIYVAGHRGLVGSALMRRLAARRAFEPSMTNSRGLSWVIPRLIELSSGFFTNAVFFVEPRTKPSIGIGTSRLSGARL